MNVLGVAFWREAHNAAAALVCDGVLVAAVEEERLSRIKHDGSVPVRAIDYCLQQAGLDMARIDAITFPHRPFRTGPASSAAEMDWRAARMLFRQSKIRGRALVHKAVLDTVLHSGIIPNIAIDSIVASGLAELHARYGMLPQIRFFGHHESHAASVFLTSGLDESTILTVDRRGGPFAAAAWHGRDRSLHRVASEPYTNSLGRFYHDVTRYLGLGENAEGKTMGLAPYGDATAFAPAFAELLDTTTARWYEYRRPPDAERFGFPARQGEAILDSPFPAFAAGAQDALERAILRAATWSLQRTGGRDGSLCLAGGVALNCSANGRLRARFPNVRVHAFPAAGDAGLGLGATLLFGAAHDEPRLAPMEHAYWGPEYSGAECETALRCAPDLRWQRPSDLADHVAERIAAGAVVGWFQGRMEIGPRALGNRSILADPRTTASRDRVNRLKGREPWRPLAPSVLADRASEFFDLQGESPFMLFAVPVRREKVPRIAGVVHVDGSARPQTVTLTQNPRFHALISAFARRTGIPLLVNTSFNGAGEPIVCTPDDAIRTFRACGLDLLVLGDYVVSRAAGMSDV